MKGDFSIQNIPITHYMLVPGYPANEAERQKEVEKYQILDTLPIENYDSITALMAYVFGSPISLVSILDRERNFLKSHHGVPFNEDPRDRSFCGHTIMQEGEIMIIPDASKDDRFADNPLVTEMGVRFYAGSPLINDKGFKIGALCVFDVEPKEISEYQVQALVNMAQQVMIVMESHFQNHLLQKAQKELVQRNENLKKFANIVSHDLKSPISGITNIANILETNLKDKVDEETNDWLGLIQKSCFSIASYIDGILSFYQSEELLNSNRETVVLEGLFKELKYACTIEKDIHISIDSTLKELRVNRGALMQILMNLVTNAVKYNSSTQRNIVLSIQEIEGKYIFEVKDNGDGINELEAKSIFELFETTSNTDCNGEMGTGIGLSIVKKLLEKLDGSISYVTKPGQGSTFTFSLPV